LVVVDWKVRALRKLLFIQGREASSWAWGLEKEVSVDLKKVGIEENDERVRGGKSFFPSFRY